MLVLGVESSCDETALALVVDGQKVLSSKIASQVALHAKFGGVVPEVAARAHLQALPLLWREMYEEAGIEPEQIDAIAVTRGPGLIGALLIGVAFARGLALQLGKPLIPVDHVHAHLHGALLGIPLGLNQEMNIFPSIALVVSGGHTHMYRMTSKMTFSLIGHSLDDACGECFDKVGKILGLPFPGGPWIEKFAVSGDRTKYPMPKILGDAKNHLFSYSGLKTHVLNLWRKLEASGEASEQAKSDISASFQEEALGQIIRKLASAYELYPESKSMIIAGGVSANKKFRELMTHQFSLPVYFPEMKYCGDNAVMIAALGYWESLEKDPQFFSEIKPWDAYSRYGTGSEL